MKSKVQDKRYRASSILHLKLDSFVKTHRRKNIYNYYKLFCLERKDGKYQM